MRKSVFVAVLVTPLGTAAPQSPAAAQQAGGPNIPAFEVVSVKANRSNSDAQSMRLLPGGRAVVTNAPLRRVILTAYELFPQQLLGGPDWIDSDRFDIVAQASENLGPSVPGGPPGRAQLMLQRLLAERFGLAVHTETRELPIFELALARADGRLAAGISPATFDCTALFAADVAVRGLRNVWTHLDARCEHADVRTNTLA
jgi:uncharacterized protein (TIGR03435 family)